MRELVLFLRTTFSLNPPAVLHYGSPFVLGLFGLCVALFVASFLVKFWRKKTSQPNVRKLTKSWSMVGFWFGIIGLLLIVSRVERVQVLAMPFLWFVWGLCLLVFIFIQWRLFRSRYYEVLPRSSVKDGDPYLPGGKRR